MLPATHEEKKNGNPWPKTETKSKLLNTQGANCTKSLNNFVESHNGHADFVEDDPSEAKSVEHVSKSSIPQHSSLSLFWYVLSCAYSKRYYTRPPSDGLSFLLSRKFLSEHSVDISKFSPFEIEPSFIAACLENSIKNISSYAPNFVREFYANLNENIVDETKLGFFHKIYVRGCILEFSPSLINHRLGCKDLMTPMFENT